MATAAMAVAFIAPPAAGTAEQVTVAQFCPRAADTGAVSTGHAGAEDRSSVSGNSTPADQTLQA